MQETTSRFRRRMLSEEKGRTFIILLFVLALILCTVQLGPGYFSQTFHPITYRVLLLILGVVALFSVGSLLQFALMGGKSNKRLAKDVKNRVIALDQLVMDYRRFVRDAERIIAKRPQTLSRSGQDNLLAMKRVVLALEERLREVRNLTQSSDMITLIGADEKLRDTLIPLEDSCAQLIEGDPLPPLEPDEWEPLLRKLSTEVDMEIMLNRERK